MTTSLISARFDTEATRARARLPSVLAIQEQQRPFIDAFLEKLRTGEYEVRHFRCPCGSDEEDVVISKRDRYGLPLTFVLCIGCGTIRIDPYLDEDSLTDFYVHLYQRMYRRIAHLDSEFRRQETYGRRVLDWARTWLEPGSCVYEYGSGGGGALKVFSDAGYEVAGMDYSQELLDYGRQRGVPNLYHGSMNALASRGLPKADLIYLHHVLEHVGDPIQALAECRAHLKSNGRVVVIVPDVSRIDSFAYPAGDLLPFLHVAHKFNFSAEGLRRVVRRAGYRDTALRGAEDAAEMWLEIVPADAVSLYDGGGATPTGRAVLDRLTRIERLHRLGLCRGQFRRRRNFAAERLAGTRLGRALASVVTAARRRH